MLNHEVALFPYFFTIGIRLFILCGIILFISISFFVNPILNTNEYTEDYCKIRWIGLTYLNIDCEMDNFYKSIININIPCITANIDTETYKDILFYRNYEEKMRSLSANSSNVSLFCLLKQNYFK